MMSQSEWDTEERMLTSDRVEAAAAQEHIQTEIAEGNFQGIDAFTCCLAGYDSRGLFDSLISKPTHSVTRKQNDPAVQVYTREISSVHAVPQRIRKGITAHTGHFGSILPKALDYRYPTPPQGSFPASDQTSHLPCHPTTLGTWVLTCLAGQGNAGAADTPVVIIRPGATVMAGRSPVLMLPRASLLRGYAPHVLGYGRGAVIRLPFCNGRSALDFVVGAAG